jgi:hypothetical protein
MITSVLSRVAEGLLNDEGSDSEAIDNAANEICHEFYLKKREYPNREGTYWFLGDPLINDGFWEERRIEKLYLVTVQKVWKKDPKEFQVNNEYRIVYKLHNTNVYFNNFRPGFWAEAIVPEHSIEFK